MRARFILPLALMSATPVAAADLTPHVAYYALSLAEIDGRDGEVADLRGALVFDWRAECDAYRTRQRAEIRFFYEDGERRDVGWTFEAKEARDGGRYEFALDRTRDGQSTDETEGVATAAATGGEARFSAPSPAVYDLPAEVLFPTAHTRGMIAAAEADERFYFSPVFVGDDEGGATALNVVVGADASADKPIEDPMIDGKAWSMRLAFFDMEAEGDAPPEHEQRIVMQRDGVVRDMLLDYGTFAINAVLTRIEPNPQPSDCG